MGGELSKARVICAMNGMGFALLFGMSKQRANKGEIGNDIAVAVRCVIRPGYARNRFR